jgi:hypothetical protein
MNKSLNKVVGDLLPQMLMFLVLAGFVGYYSEGANGLKLAGVAILSHVGWAPIYYAYLQRKARIEAAKEERRRKEWEADAPNRAARRAVAKAIADHIRTNPGGSAHA